MRHNLFYWRFAVLAVALPVAGADFTKLAGDLPGEITARQGPYLVTGDIYVPAGKHTTIGSGAVFLFKNFTGLHVQGTLEVKGSADWPVIFTSECDQNYNPGSQLRANPYDWNGIYIHSDAMGTIMEHFEVLYSVYGINSQTKFIRLTAGMFHYNGRANLTIEEKEIAVGLDPFSYTLSVKDAKVDGVPVKILDDPAAGKRSIIRYSGLCLFIGGGILGIMENGRFIQDANHVNDIKGDLINNLSPDFQNAVSKRNNSAFLTGLGYFLCLAGACGFSWTFSF
jgi:hypothetical protein